MTRLNFRACPPDSIRVNTWHGNLASLESSDAIVSRTMDIVYLELEDSIPWEPSSPLRTLQFLRQWNEDLENNGGILRQLVLAREMLKEGGTLYLRCPSEILRQFGNTIFQSKGVMCDGGTLLSYTRRGAERETFAEVLPVQLANCMSS
jgi:hypothetical protein